MRKMRKNTKKIKFQLERKEINKTPAKPRHLFESSRIDSRSVFVWIHFFFALSATKCMIKDAMYECMVV